MRCFPVIFWLISLLLVAVQVDGNENPDRHSGDKNGVQENLNVPGGKYHLAGSKGSIEAQLGSDVVLPCSVKPPVNVTDAIVKWMFNFSKTVHLFHNEADDLKSQDERYKDRTSLNHKMLEHGNVSLMLADVTKNDAGIYTCFVIRRPGLSDEINVTLVVDDGKENKNPDRHSGDKNGVQENLNATREPDRGVNGCVVGWVVAGVIAGVIGGVVGGVVVSLIKYCVVRRCRGEPIFPRRNNNFPHEEVRNDGGMEMEQLRNPRGNGNQGDEAEPLQNQEEPN